MMIPILWLGLALAGGDAGLLTLAPPAKPQNETLQSLRDEAKRQLEERTRDFLAGRATPEFLAESSRSFLDSELALSSTKAERYVAIEAHWRRLKDVEEVDKRRKEESRFPLADFESNFKKDLLLATQWLIEAKTNRKGKPNRPQLHTADCQSGDGNSVNQEESPEFYFGPPHGAAMPHDSIPGNPHDLLELHRARFEIAATILERRLKEFTVKGATVEAVYCWSRRLLEAQFALFREHSDFRLAAQEAHWRRMKKIEEMEKARFEAGRIPVSDWINEAKYYRLEAEIGLIEMKASLNTQLGGLP